MCIIIGLLSACSQQPRVPLDQHQLSQQQATQAIPDVWRITAKLGIRTTNDSGSLTINWQQQADRYYIQFSGPLGQGSGTLTGSPNGIIIEQANKPVISSNEAEQLIQESFGWALPVDHLNYWVRGLPSPLLAITQASYLPSGVLDTLNQSNWVLEYQRYSQVEQWLLPSKIRATNGNTRLTLIIKHWQVSDI